MKKLVSYIEVRVRLRFRVEGRLLRWPFPVIPKNEARLYQLSVGASFCHWATVTVFRAAGERRFKMGTA